MNADEISLILEKGLKSLGMTITTPALDRIVLLSRGLPYYPHLLGLHSSRASLEKRSLEIDLLLVNLGIEAAIEDAQQTIRSAYLTATDSAQKDNLFRQVLLACALAETDERGFFRAAAVREPLRQITPGRNLDIPNFAQHLSDFSSEKRGFILRKEIDVRPKYRFSDPLMQPHVIMEGLRSGMISDENLIS
jgi:hypothetical protein